MTKGKLVVMSGPSAGVGKDTILKGFLAGHPDWYHPVATTTRSPRAGEEHDKDMKFVDQETFELWEKQGKFLETDFHAGAWYGTLHEPVESLLKAGKKVLLRIDVNGAQLIKKALPQAILVFIDAENWEALEARIRNRGTEDEATIQQRLELANSERAFKSKYDYVVINETGKPEKAIADFEKILEA